MLTHTEHAHCSGTGALEQVTQSMLTAVGQGRLLVIRETSRERPHILVGEVIKEKISKEVNSATIIT